MVTVDIVTGLELAGYALGALGGALVFMEFFQEPTYVEYDPDFNGYTIDISPQEVREHTWLGRVGGFSIALGFALLFLSTFLA
ncbi:hypothetical protein [Haloprofundus salinisoli]|uniref:hypothetical protein n=1 Tax=Haloprofundus salinisoli TaxID=2876193 RepID=UPI001CCBDB95|nr:hypothetical protein [Haloprofundus salinisoli]